MNENILKQLYYTLIYPYLTYCLLIWGKAPSCYLNKIVLLQKKAIRIITNSERLAHTEPLFKQLHLIAFPDLLTYWCLLFIYKYKNNLLPQCMYNELTIELNLNINDNNHRATVRRQASLHLYSIPTPRTNLRERSLFHQCHLLHRQFFINLGLHNSSSLYILIRYLKSFFS